MSCNVCVEHFNKSSRLEITCEFCDFKVCRECCEKYILNSSELANCMSCKNEWSREIMMKKFTKKFVDNQYKKHREQYLYEKELALLPATQVLVEEIIRKEKIEQRIADLKSQKKIN